MYGIAFDLGTTTLVAYLCNLKNGVIEKTSSMFNPQIETGADILTRLTFSQKSPENKKHLEKLLGEAIRKLTNEICQDLEEFEDTPGIDTIKRLERILLAGNPIIMGSIKDYPLDDLCSEVIRLPGIGNFVGADALAAAFLLNSQKHSGNTMFIDIGTNTEIVLLTPNCKYATSAAAGPAMEGGNISCGMVACEGAISIVSTTAEKASNSDLSIKLIAGNDDDRVFRTVPKGICGSGLISLLSTLKSVGAVDETGYLLSRSEAIAAGVPGRIAGRIYEGADLADIPCKCRYLLITDEVYVSQEDIRNLQLVFSAIHSGIDVLLQQAHMEPSDFDNIYLAGAFGTTIRRVDWMNLNILPKFDAGKVTEAGNLAGLGAAHILMNSERISEVVGLKEEIVTLMLEGIASFEELFIANMHF